MMSTSLLVAPQPIIGSFNFAVFPPTVIEIQPNFPLTDLSTVSLEDEVGSIVELDFDARTGIFAGLRLQAYHDVGQQKLPMTLPEVMGMPALTGVALSRKLTIPRLVCSKQMTSKGRGNLLLNWSGRLNFDVTSVLEFESHTRGLFRACYLHDELVALSLEKIHGTLLNEMPDFDSPGN